MKESKLYYHGKLTVRVGDVVGSQDAVLRVVALLVDEVDGDRSASSTTVAAKSINKIPDLSQGEGSSLREKADTTSSDLAASLEAQLAFETTGLAANASTDGDGGGGTDTDDVVTAVVDGVGVLVRGGKDIVPELKDVHIGVVLKGGETAETGATAVDCGFWS